MRTSKKQTFILSLIIAFGLVLFLGTGALGGNDSSIKGDLRTDIQDSMQAFIDRNTVNGVYSLYDPVDGKFRQLTFKELHKGIVKKGAYYVSCADFTDSDNTLVDLDFLVMPTGDTFVVPQAIIHSVDGKKRKYHIEN